MSLKNYLFGPLFKKFVSERNKNRILLIKEKIYNRPLKFFLLKKIQLRQKKMVKGLIDKKVIRVVFLVIHKSVWKVDSVFNHMIKDPYFDPVILVCPDLIYQRNDILKNLTGTYDYFHSKGYPVINSYNSVNKTWLALENLRPDILLFTNPHNLTRDEYYSQAYKKYGYLQ